jgi:hypothetical protein
MKSLSGLNPQFSMSKIHPASSGYGATMSKTGSSKNFMRMAPVKKKEVVQPKKIVPMR